MIIVKKTKYLVFRNSKYRCALGKNGIKKKIKEGYFITPKGIYSLKK
jgi:L,D-peptidoglycan transpeptidase YkuD (ErfK/YbiS/YcfS/YnhG family)